MSVLVEPPSRFPEGKSVRVSNGITQVFLGACLAALPACSSDPTGTDEATGASGLFGKGTSQLASGGASSTLNSSDKVVFGGGYGIRTGAATQSGGAAIVVDPLTIDRSMNAVGTITINGLLPSLWTQDQRLIHETTMVELVPRYDYMASGLARLTGDGVLTFRNLRATNYHMVIRDGGGNIPWRSRMSVDAERKSHINMLSFFVSPVSIFSPARPGGTTPSAFNLDLYWDTQSFPCEQGIPVTDPDPNRPHNFGEYYSYEDSFSIKGRSFDSLNSPVEYRFVAYDGSKVCWVSSWHEPVDAAGHPDPNGYVKVCWNGYSSLGSGPADMPSETRSGNAQLAERSYFYSVQFKQAGCRFPEDAPNPSRADDNKLLYRNGNFIQTFYGGSQLAPFTLKHGQKPPEPSPSPSATPNPWPAPAG